MTYATDDTVFVGTTELRKNIPKFTKESKTKTIVVMKRGQPVAVLENFKEYEEKKKMIDTFEDIVLGYLAIERIQNSSENDYLSESEMAQKLGIKSV